MTNPIRETLLFKKEAGCLIGSAIGDAFGIRVEMMHYKDIRDQYGRVTHFDRLPPRKPSQQSPLERWYPFGVQPALVGGFHPLGAFGREVGTYTDDTRYRLLVLHAILQKGGPIDGKDFAEALLSYRLMAEGANDHPPTLSWDGPQREYARLLASLPQLTELSNQRRPCRAGWDAPLGMIHPGDPASAAEEGYAMAVAVATALSPGATIDDVIDNVLKCAWTIGRYANEFVGRLEKLLEIAAKCSSVDDLFEPFYREFIIMFPPWEGVFALEMVPCALAMCYIARANPAEAIIGATNIGRDADTIAGMAGELAGALHGVDALPKDWVDKILRVNPQPDLNQMVEDLCILIKNRAQMQAKNASQVLSML